MTEATENSMFSPFMNNFLDALKTVVNFEVFVENQVVVIYDKDEKIYHVSPRPDHVDPTLFMLFVAEVNKVLADRGVILHMKKEPPSRKVTRADFYLVRGHEDEADLVFQCMLCEGNTHVGANGLRTHANYHQLTEYTVNTTQILWRIS